MRFILTLITAILFVQAAYAELPEGPNVTEKWSQDTMEGVRILYGYNSEIGKFSCRCDYYHDGKIRLLVTESYYHITDSPVRSATTFYFLRAADVPQAPGNALLRFSYKYMSGGDLRVEPVLETEDLFKKHCVPLLNDLFDKIPKPEVKMWKDQYGPVFGVK